MAAREGTPVRRGPLLVTGALAAFGAAAIAAVALPSLWRIWQLHAMLFGALALIEFTAVIILLGWPTRRTALAVAAVAGTSVVVWVLDRVLGLFAPDPWLPADAVLGITDHLAAGLQVVGVLAMLAVARRGARLRPSRARRVTAWIVLFPVSVLVLATGAAGVTAAGDGFGGTGVPTGAVYPGSLPAGTLNTVEYCRPDGIPLAMDLYTPPAHTGPAPLALYVHGGGFVLGGRKPNGVGARLADSGGALFTPLQRALNARGFVVASIDYRLAPAARWPAPITDTKCAVRFLKDHAAPLGIDPARIGVWGGDAGGVLASLLGTAGPAAGFDVGQYPAQTSTVQAVVDMFGPADLSRLDDPVYRTIVHIGLSDANARWSASPATYVTSGAPPFLIVQGEDFVRAQSVAYADRLRAAGVPVTYLPVQGTGHTLDTPTQHPSPDELTATIVTFLADTLH